MVIKELVLKVANVCNLNCDYCYVFNQGDFTYKDGPKIMSDEIAMSVIEKIAEHCNTHELKDFVVIFHGGEPLLAKKDFYRRFVTNLKETVKDVDFGFGLQTNGTLISEEWLSLFSELGISVGVSLDGTREASKYRVYRRTGKNAYDEIMQGLDLLYRKHYPVNVLSVINILESPHTIYEHLKNSHVFSVEFLFPDITHDHIDDKKGLISQWLIEMFDLWYNDPDDYKPMIRLFDIIIGLIIGVERGNETMGRKYNQCLCVKPGGDIQAVDNLMICGNGFTKLNLHINTNTFDDALKTDLMVNYYNAHQDKFLCERCNKCIIKHICGGGHLAHRYSIENKFNNPSVYCKDISRLVMYIQNKVLEDLSENLDQHTNTQKLVLEDFQ